MSYFLREQPSFTNHFSEIIPFNAGATSLSCNTDWFNTDNILADRPMGEGSVTHDWNIGDKTIISQVANTLNFVSNRVYLINVILNTAHIFLI